MILLGCGASVSLRAQNQSGGQTSVPQSAAPAAVGTSLDNQGIKDYLLGPNDTLDIRVFGQPDLNWTGEVDGTGYLSSLPFIEQPILAKCRTEKQVQKDVIAAYSKWLRNPQISVRVTGRNSRSPAIVYGAVRAPTRVQMLRRVKLNEIIAFTGGITERASGDIQVLHTEPVMCPEAGDVDEFAQAASDGLSVPLKVYKISDLVAGKEEANPQVRPGDVVIVSEALPIYVTGSVFSPNNLFLRDGLTLSRALAMVGGVKKEGKKSDVRIYRQKPGGQQEVIHVDYAAIQKQQKPDIPLQPYDVIDVPEASALSPGRLADTFSKAVLGVPASIMQNAPLRFIY